MNMEQRIELTRRLMESSGIIEMPFGMHYTDRKPENGFGPAVGAVVSRELEEKNGIEPALFYQNFSCLLWNVWLARKKEGSAAFISRKRYGCFGGVFYAGFQEPLRWIEYYVSTGIEGTPMQGERYMASPEAMRRFLREVTPPPAPAEYCVLKPLPLFAADEDPEHVVVFGRMETLCGLATLATFATGDSEIVRTPFGSGCAHLVAWPRVYAANGLEKIVLGTFDPYARRYMKPDEMFMTFPLRLFDRMLDAVPESHLCQVAWIGIMEKIKKSQRVWGKK